MTEPWHCREIPNGNEPLIVCERENLQREVDQLQQWKREAIEIIASWEDVWVALGRPGSLGESKAVAALRTVLASATSGGDR